MSPRLGAGNEYQKGDHSGRPCGSLWEDGNAELAKVLVQRNGSPDAEIVDHDLARAVGEAPTGISTLLEENPRPV